VFFGDRKEWNKQHTICTWQSLAAYSRRTKEGEVIVPIEDFIKDVICVMVDEVHSAKGKELKDLLTGVFADVPIRWGLTGTVPPLDHEFMCLLSSLGPVVGEISAASLQERDVLANCQVDIIQLVDDHVGFDDYATEHKYLLSDKERLKHIAELIQFYTESGNTLVLVDRIESGGILRDLIPDSVFISGVVKAKKRQEEYKSVQESEDKIIIATYGVASTGINIPRLFNLMMIEPGKSFVRVIQSIGRGLRMAHDKDYVRIIDMCSSLKFSKRHLTKRKAFYTKAQYPFNMKKVTYR
jgi:superfamily II DNA or RNA helicase